MACGVYDYFVIETTSALHIIFHKQLCYARTGLMFLIFKLKWRVLYTHARMCVCAYVCVCAYAYACARVCSKSRQIETGVDNGSQFARLTGKFVQIAVARSFYKKLRERDSSKNFLAVS